MAHKNSETLLTGIVAHPWASLRDALVLALGLTLTVLLFRQYDIFGFIAGLADPSREISATEAMVLGCLGASFVWLFVARRYDDLRRDAEIDPRQLARQLRELRELAMRDPLTSLPNRRVLIEALETAMATPPIGPRSHALFLLDLNGFKQVNDRFGHAVGDQALQAVVERFRRVTRADDVLARLGGDEFAVLARNVDVAAAQAIGTRFIHALCKDVRTDETTHAIGVAIGVALFPSDSNTAEKLLRHADIAMYRAKLEPASALIFFHSIAEHVQPGARASASA